MISPHQVAALRRLSRGPLYQQVHGWCEPDKGHDGIASATVLALERKGFATTGRIKVDGRFKKRARISKVGRRWLFHAIVGGVIRA